MDERSTLIGRLERGEGTAEEAEAWLVRLKEIDPYFAGSDYMHQLEIDVGSRRLFERLVAEWGTSPTRERLVALVQSLMAAEGSEEEQHATAQYLSRCVSDPDIINYIYYPPDGKEMSAEAIVTRALTYRPIEL